MPLFPIVSSHPTPTPYASRIHTLIALQAIPTQNLPQRSHEVTAKPGRRHLNIVKGIPLPDIPCTKNIYTIDKIVWPLMFLQAMYMLI